MGKNRIYLTNIELMCYTINMKTKNIKFLEKELFYWAKKLNIRLNNIMPDKRMWFMAMAEKYNGNNTIYYNPKYFKYEKKYFIIHLIFHELGHFKNDNFSINYCYDEYINKIISEYKAEKFALKYMKKYYFKYYKQFCNWIKIRGAKRIRECDYLRNGKFYFYAFSQIPEWEKYL